MKKFARIFIPVLTFAFALLSLAGCAERNRADQNADADFSKKGDVLVVYFTWSGHLRSMAHWIADEVEADYARILRKEEYPVSYNETVDVAKKEKNGNIYPEINLSLSDVRWRRESPYPRKADAGEGCCIRQEGRPFCARKQGQGFRKRCPQLGEGALEIINEAKS